jgi:hypothetical protein
MADRVWMGRIATAALAVAVMGGLGGCSSAGIKFTNVSDSWLNVWFYVGDADVPENGVNEMYRTRELQLEPGATADYRPKHDLVHIQVQEVSPTWVPTGNQYWIELLTRPPLHIAANGRGDRLEFKSFHGEVALIPDRERAQGRFEYLTAPKPEPAAEIPETAAAIDSGA